MCVWCIVRCDVFCTGENTSTHIHTSTYTPPHTHTLTHIICSSMNHKVSQALHWYTLLVDNYKFAWTFCVSMWYVYSTVCLRMYGQTIYTYANRHKRTIDACIFVHIVDEYFCAYIRRIFLCINQSATPPPSLHPPMHALKHPHIKHPHIKHPHTWSLLGHFMHSLRKVACRWDLQTGSQTQHLMIE